MPGWTAGRPSALAACEAAGSPFKVTNEVTNLGDYVIRRNEASWAMSESARVAPDRSAGAGAEAVSLARSADSLQVFSFHNIAPDNLGCLGGMYSRSSESILEKVQQVTQERSYSFYDRFYHNYGHRSLGDMSMPNFALEGLTELEAIFVTGVRRHRPLWNGQQRSTRYQDFTKTGFIVPEELEGSPHRESFIAACDGLFSAYNELFGDVHAHYLESLPQPEGLSDAAYKRTIRARALDVVRYLLPLSTATSVFQILSARTLETQIVDLLSSPYPRVRRVGEALRDACRKACIDPQAARIREIVRELREQGVDPDALAEIEDLTASVQPSPTLVKYTQPDSYWLETQQAFAETAEELLKNIPVDRSRRVTLVVVDDPQIEFLSRILYQLTHHSFQQVVDAVGSLSAERRKALVDQAFARRGRHDEWLPESRSRQLHFDILMDIGGYRDLHRHRRCEQYLQPFTLEHGFETPEVLTELGLAEPYRRAVEAAEDIHRQIAASDGLTADYALTLAHRCRSVFAMDMAEAAFIIELRSRPSGHFSYRRVAYEMYEAVAEKFPAFASHIRAVHPDVVDLLDR